jgi:hypothetical protein
MDSQEYIEALERKNPVQERPWEPGDDYPHRGKRVSNETRRSKIETARSGRRRAKLRILFVKFLEMD